MRGCMVDRPFPAAQPHGELKKLFDDIYFVTGSSRMAKPPLAFSRNMTVVREGDALTLINSVRLDESGLKALDALGRVEHVLCIAGFHGMDDAFYKDRYGAKVWAMEGHIYASGVNTRPSEADAYFHADTAMNEETELPISGAKIYAFKTSGPPEGLLVLEREDGIIVSGDCLQNWHRTDRFFNIAAKVAMRTLGFIKPHNLGPGWLKSAKPDPSEIQGILDLTFEHVLPAHGEEVIGNAKQAYRPIIDKFS